MTNAQRQAAIAAARAAAHWFAANPEDWTQGQYARNAAGDFINQYSPDAVCFCAIGRMSREADASGSHAGWVISPVLHMHHSLAYAPLSSFNDSRDTDVFDVIARLLWMAEELEKAA